MAIVMSREMLPEVGDTVTEVKVDADGRTADVHFKSGRWVAVHLGAEPRCRRCRHTEAEHAEAFCYCACEDDPSLRGPEISEDGETEKGIS